MERPILVLGALGNVGTEAVEYLLSRGARVRAADLFVDKIYTRWGDRVEAVAFDFTKPDTFPAAFRGIERLFLVRPPQISDTRKVMFPALETARSYGVRQIAFLSLIGIERNTVVPHYPLEQWLYTSGLEYTFLRCSFFMQNLSTTHRTEIRNDDEIFLPAGKARTSFIDVRDIGAVAALILTEDSHAGRAYDLTGSQALDYYEVANLFSEILGRKIVYKDPTSLSFFMRQLRRGGALPYALVTTWLYTNTRNGMADVVTGEVERLLGREPITMRQFINDFQTTWRKETPVSPISRL
jgi:uncharacterized protein YbjT (DUF2867 family)